MSNCSRLYSPTVCFWNLAILIVTALDHVFQPLCSMLYVWLNQLYLCSHGFQFLNNTVIFLKKKFVYFVPKYDILWKWNGRLVIYKLLQLTEWCLTTLQSGYISLHPSHQWQMFSPFCMSSPILVIESLSNLSIWMI